MACTRPAAHVPVVRNTFLTIEVPRAVDSRRSQSASPRGCADNFAQQLHALMYKPVPAVLPRRRWADEDEDFDTAEVVVNPIVFEAPVTSPVKAASVKRWNDSGTNGDAASETGSSTDAGEPCTPSSAEDSVDSQDEEELLRLVPRNESGNAMSLGSIAHEEGTCKPCVFAHNESKPCANGIRCPFCHFPHPPKKRLRLCKKKRMEMVEQKRREADLRLEQRQE